MRIDIPDEFEISTKDVETMTQTVAKILLLFTSNEHFTVTMENDPDKGVLTAKKAYGNLLYPDQKSVLAESQRRIDALMGSKK